MKLLLLFSSLFFSMPSWAAPEPPSVDVMAVLSALIFVILLILALAWLFNQSKLGRHFGQQGIKVIASTPLGRREKLLVVQLGEQQYLLAATAQQINLIDKLDQPWQPQPVESVNFAEQLAKMMKKK
ncbi:flagellar biosynthetic protein FliO [Motilimonas cestriensis]|uniref:Flagellar protein n=1 Tax=Motilimonas cestriensis TaxID=2742685 RepID=A0ABS8WCW0_9GAMM|nr:flagellar biosynthetic protein FliO [Motilimonas cestriensis]MCE2595548.1 flagellar biosynthetic protein FliO [Motilimonas cestriensis]